MTSTMPSVDAHSLKDASQQSGCRVARIGDGALCAAPSFSRSWMSAEEDQDLGIARGARLRSAFSAAAHVMRRGLRKRPDG